MKAAHAALEMAITQGESLVFHYTSRDSAALILSRKSPGLRASKEGQLGGGLSVCVTPPHELGWEQWGDGQWRATLGRALWGEKWENILVGGKVSLCHYLRLRPSSCLKSEHLASGCGQS
jgi:hypothetical protein